MPTSENQITDSGNYRVAGLSSQTKTKGEQAAEYFKYYRQQNIGAGPASFKRISARTLYVQHRRTFDKLAEIFSKYGLNLETYVKFFVAGLGKTERDIDNELLSAMMIRRFADRLSIVEQRKQIYGWFMKSAKNLADFCLEEGCSSAFEGVRLLIAGKKLAAWYMCGRLSKYFLVTIPGFAKAIPKLDHFSKCELNEVLSKFDMYKTEVNKAFLYVRRRMANPYEITDALISECRQEFVKRKEMESLFDPSLDEKPKRV